MLPALATPRCRNPPSLSHSLLSSTSTLTAPAGGRWADRGNLWVGGGEGTCLLEVEGRGEAVPCTPWTGGGAGVRAPRAGGGAGAYMPRMGGGCLAGACLPLTGGWGRAGTGACSPWMEGGDGTGALSHWTGGGGGAGACTPLTGRGGGAGAWSGGGAAPGPRSVAGVPGAPSPWLTSLTPLAPLRSPTPLAPLASPAPLVPLALPAPLALLTSPNPLPQLTSPIPLAPLVPSTPLPPLTSSAPNPAPAPAVFATTASAVVDPSVDGARATGMRERDRAGGLGGRRGGGRLRPSRPTHLNSSLPSVLHYHRLMPALNVFDLKWRLVFSLFLDLQLFLSQLTTVMLAASETVYHPCTINYTTKIFKFFVLASPGSALNSQILC